MLRYASTQKTHSPKTPLPITTYGISPISPSPLPSAGVPAQISRWCCREAKTFLRSLTCTDGLARGPGSEAARELVELERVPAAQPLNAPTQAAADRLAAAEDLHPARLWLDALVRVCWEDWNERMSSEVNKNRKCTRRLFQPRRLLCVLSLRAVHPPASANSPFPWYREDCSTHCNRNQSTGMKKLMISALISVAEFSKVSVLWTNTSTTQNSATPMTFVRPTLLEAY